MTEADDLTVSLSYEDAQALWDHWARDPDDLLAHAAFERTLRFAAGVEDEGLYFRPGGWSVALPETVARIACAAAILAGGFEIAGLHDVEREIIIAAASLVSTMDLRRIRLTEQDQSLVDRVRARHLDGTPISPADARKALPPRLRQDVSDDQITEALDRLVRAGFADREGPALYVVRATNGGAWIRISLRSARS
jgi:hypothetical protein